MAKIHRVSSAASPRLSQLSRRKPDQKREIQVETAPAAMCLVVKYPTARLRVLVAKLRLHRQLFGHDGHGLIV